MRILTWNIHGISLGDRNERFPKIRNAIEQYQPDVACIQEAFFQKSRSMLSSLNEYYISRELNLFPPLTTKGGLVTLSKAKPLEVSFHPYQSQGNILTEQKWDRLIGKGFLETIIEDPQFGKVTIINTHNVCTYTDDIDGYLEGQTEQLVKNVRKRKGNGERIIVAGDFNLKRSSRLYPQLMGMLHDATEGLEQFHFFEYETIDYIFTGDKHHVESAYIYHESWQKYPSDHPGILVDIKTRKHEANGQDDFSSH